MLFAGSLLNGFLVSNFTGRLLVLIQIAGSLLMIATIIGKWMHLKHVQFSARRFIREFSAGRDVLDYYVTRRPNAQTTGLTGIYARTCERLFKLRAKNVRSLLSAEEGEAGSPAGGGALNGQEVELVRGACDHALDEEEIRVDSKMNVIATVVALEPMLGLLGTVWGVLDAFYEMGTAATANLATIAPSISAALVTTVVGLIVAIPGVLCFNWLSATIRDIQSEMEGFADELIGRIKCEFEGGN